MVSEGAANSILIKVKTKSVLSETFEAFEMAKEAGYTLLLYHTSQDTVKIQQSDIVLLQLTGQIKTGSLSRVQTASLNNKLLRIEDQLGEVAEYRGLKSFSTTLKNKIVQ